MTQFIVYTYEPPTHIICQLSMFYPAVRENILGQEKSNCRECKTLTEYEKKLLANIDLCFVPPLPAAHFDPQKLISDMLRRACGEKAVQQRQLH